MAASDRTRASQIDRSIFDLPRDFFDSSSLLRSLASETLPRIRSSRPPPTSDPVDSSIEIYGEAETRNIASSKDAVTRWTCNTCRSEFESLQDQRSHFKSDLHRLNVKLNVCGKNIVKEEDFYELGGDSLFEDIDVSSTSGSENEVEKGSIPNTGISGKTREGVKQKLYLHLQSGDTVSIWRCLILDESEGLLLESDGPKLMGNGGGLPYVEEGELINRMKTLVREPRDKTHVRIVLLASGGHFAGCVFDGNSIIAHKTFHRYVVRAKAGKTQSSNDAAGRVAHSAGSSLRRYNEAALKKEIQALFVTWKVYIDSSVCIFIYAPSKNRQMLFDEERPPGCVIRHVPLTVRRPTLKEAKRIYSHLTHVAYEVYDNASLEGGSPLYIPNEGKNNELCNEAKSEKHIEIKETFSGTGSDAECLPIVGENSSLSAIGNEMTPLHEAAKSGDAQQTLELLEQGLDPCIKDPRGRTPYMLASDKEVRNTFRRFMAFNIDKWDWHASNVPSPLTKEMEDSQAAKQAEKDAKRKAKAKELKKLRKAKEKAQAATPNASATAAQVQASVPASTVKQQPQVSGRVIISKEEEQRRALAAEREKRAAAAERRIAALNIRPPAAAEAEATASAVPLPSQNSSSDVLCSCCNASLAGKVPFHRYCYRYCSTSCMFVHKEMLEDK